MALLFCFCSRSAVLAQFFKDVGSLCTRTAKQLNGTVPSGKRIVGKPVKKRRRTADSGPRFVLTPFSTLSLQFLHLRACFMTILTAFVLVCRPPLSACTYCQIIASQLNLVFECLHLLCSLSWLGLGYEGRNLVCCMYDVTRFVRRPVVLPRQS